jgi:hypothetical protein
LSPSKLIKNFLPQIFEEQVYKNTLREPLQELICNEFVEICKAFDSSKIQESWSWRNTHQGRELAKCLIDERGEIRKNILFKGIQCLEENLYSLGSGRYHDGLRQKHALKILKLFYENTSFSQALKRINRPLGQPLAERLIRETLLLDEGAPITDVQARQAALSALLTSLRQNVGSCFATAPAILIQQDTPLQFLNDIGQLFGTGRLTRIQEGVDYTVPLSLSWGMGELLKPTSWSSLGKNPLPALALSPGLQAAFEIAGLMDKKGTPSEKWQSCVRLLQEAHIYQEGETHPFAIFWSDQVIKAILLQAFKITEQDVSAFSLRTVQGPLAALVIQAPAGAQGKKSLACSRYLKAYELAKGAFKGLTDNALLKAWEFTLASLSESKADFAKWNLYSSLGVNPEEPHGIGQNLYAMLQSLLNRINEEITICQSNYDHLFAQAKYLEGRIRNAATEREAGWIQAEYQIRRHELNRVVSHRDESYDKGQSLQHLYPLLIEFYGEKIRDYFQEVYDAEMHDISTNPYDDSPAGFRLMYKYGRAQTALWTMIHSSSEYIHHLVEFFVATEIDLTQLPACEGLQKEISELITVAINTVKRSEFLESSLFRLAKAYGEPLISNPMEHLDQVKRKPWVYISGGTMSTLIKYYWKSANMPRVAKRWVESETELLAFFIDTLKECPLSVQRLYQESSEQGMLAFSPTHAFVCKPGWNLFRQGWESDIYTYTWIKEQWLLPQQRFLSQIVLDARMVEVIVDHFLSFFPSSYHAVVAHVLKNVPFAMTPYELREHFIKTLAYEKWLREGNRLQAIAEELDSILYRLLPLFPEYQLRERIKILFSAIDEMDDPSREILYQVIDTAEEYIGKHQILSASDLREIAQGLLILALKKTRASIYYSQKITAAMQRTGLCYPQPLLVADTNWVNNTFGFTLNPGTNSLEFWRFDALGTEGRPITVWKRYLNGSDRQDWGLYIHPHQYGA